MRPTVTEHSKRPQAPTSTSTWVRSTNGIPIRAAHTGQQQQQLQLLKPAPSDATATGTRVAGGGLRARTWNQAAPHILPQHAGVGRRVRAWPWVYTLATKRWHGDENNERLARLVRVRPRLDSRSDVSWGARAKKGAFPWREARVRGLNLVLGPSIAVNRWEQRSETLAAQLAEPAETQMSPRACRARRKHLQWVQRPRGESYVPPRAQWKTGHPFSDAL